MYENLNIKSDPNAVNLKMETNNINNICNNLIYRHK